MYNKVVARFADGHSVKGTTVDFSPMKDVFHVIDPSAPGGASSVEIHKEKLKALFFVRDLGGDPQHVKRNDSLLAPPAAGRRIRIVFKDGEVLEGFTTAYQPGGAGFFIQPVDAGSNTERCYVVTAAAEDIALV